MSSLAVAVGCNLEYLPHAVTTLNSLLQTNRDKISQVSLLTIDVDESELEKVRRWSKRRFDFDLQTIKVQEPRIETANVQGYLSKEAYLRFCLPHILPHLKSVLYLDSDTIVLGDLAYILKLAEDINLRPLDEPAIFAAQDHGKNQLQRMSLLGYPLESYFNSGVMLINLEKWRHENLAQRLFDLEKSEGGKFRWMDQDLLNISLARSWGELGSDYNEHSRSVLPTTRIIHFAGRQKPDLMGYRHPAKRVYRKFRFGTPYPLLLPKGIAKYLFRTLPWRGYIRLYRVLRPNVIAS